MSENDKPNRNVRNETKASSRMTNETFMRLADKFIDLANTQNKTVSATDLHMIFLYAAARYNAHVARNVLEVEEHEPFVNEMTTVYQEMLRNHLADPAL